MTYVYVVRCPEWSKPFYVGITDNVEQRVREHNAGKNASTNGGRWELVYYEAYVNRSYAQHREHKLKTDRRVWRHVRERILESLK